MRGAPAAGIGAAGWPAVAADVAARGARQAGRQASLSGAGSQSQPAGPRRPGPGLVNARGRGCVAEAPGRRAGVGARRVDARSAAQNEGWMTGLGPV